MKPKEKADQLVNEFRLKLIYYPIDLEDADNIGLIAIDHAKIVVNHLIEESKFKSPYFNSKEIYWRLVIKELNLL